MANRIGSHSAIPQGARQIGAIAHPLAQRMPHCARCEDSGSVWIICPDAGAAKVPCGCRRGGQELERHGLALADLGAVAVFAGGCTALFLLL